MTRPIYTVDITRNHKKTIIHISRRIHEHLYLNYICVYLWSSELIWFNGMIRVQYWIFWNLLKTSSAYVRQSGFSRDCFMAIKLEFDYAFILNTLNNLFIYILIWMSMHVTWWNICITTLKLSNETQAQYCVHIKYLQNLGNAYFNKMLKFSHKLEWKYYIFLSYANCIAE